MVPCVGSEFLLPKLRSRSPVIRIIFRQRQLTLSPRFLSGRAKAVRKLSSKALLPNGTDLAPGKTTCATAVARSHNVATQVPRWPFSSLTGGSNPCHVARSQPKIKPSVESDISHLSFSFLLYIRGLFPLQRTLTWIATSHTVSPMGPRPSAPATGSGVSHSASIRQLQEMCTHTLLSRPGRRHTSPAAHEDR